MYTLLYALITVLHALKIKYVFIVLILSGLTFSINAQVIGDDILLKLDSIVNDSLSRDTISPSCPHPLCLPLMYVPTPLPSLSDTTKQSQYSIAAIRRNALRYITTHHADLYVSVSDTNRLKNLEIEEIKVHHAVVDSSARDKLKINRTIQNKKSKWRKTASVSLQITQNYATNNWHQGAVNSFAMLGGAKARADYKNENISWENSAEWRFGVSTVSGDTVRKMNTTDDRIYVLSKFGYQVHKHWYVSVLAEFKTNLFPNFQKNSNRVNTTFLTPIRYTMGVGIDCKVFKGVSINFSPATYKLVYALNSNPEKVNVTDFGIATGNNIIHEIGSSVRVEWRWKPIKEIVTETKFYFFTNYIQIETELEINVDFIINRYLSAKLMLHPRYDGTVDAVADQKSKMQFKELISVGFAHTFR